MRHIKLALLFLLLHGLLFGCNSSSNSTLPINPTSPTPPSTTPVVGPGFVLENWQWVRPQPAGNSFYDIINVNGVYIAVGDAGEIYTSSDGLVYSPTMLRLSSITYGNGIYMGVGFGDAILTSSTGRDWTLHDPINPDSSGYSGVAFGGNTFVALHSGDVFTSKDNGVTWTKQNLLNPSLNLFRQVLFENNQFIANTDSNSLYTSSDGITWTAHTIPENDFSIVCYGQGKYVAKSNSTGRVYTSPDAVTWTMTGAIGEQIYGLTYGNGLFVAVGGNYNEWGSIYTSSDAITWTKQEVTFLFPLFRVVYTGARFVAVGQAGIIVESSDGLTWTEVSSRLTKRTLNSIAYGNNLLIATMNYVYEHALYLSSDGGASWTTLPHLPGDVLVNRIKFMDGFFYAFCGSSIFTSSDGYNWTNFYTSTVANPSSGFNDLIHANGLYVLVGFDPKILVSTDGLAWTAGNWTGPYNAAFTSVTFGNNTFVAVGNSGQVISSQDGMTWSDANIYASDNFTGVAFGNNQFVVVGTYGTVYSSTDGKNWSNRVYGYDSYLSQVIYSPSGFVAVGAAETDTVDYTRLHTSIDGIHWTDEILPAVGDLNALAYGSNTYYASGSWGIILKSDKVTFYPDLPIYDGR
jgi:photosystem II stability/assembly factor-like uncharacterized protein